MVISQVDTDEVVERWQFDIQCENTAKSMDEKGEKRFVSTTDNYWFSAILGWFFLSLSVLF